MEYEVKQVRGIKKISVKAKVQKLGSTLSSMVMPNIGALIAWGVLTVLFIPNGYFPNEAFATMVDPILKYLIPILIGYNGGKLFAEERGGVVGAIATMGVIVGADIPMLLGAMIMGPLGGFVIKKFDTFIEGKVKTGFEMLVNNFSSGLIGFLLALIGFMAVGPFVSVMTNLMARGVEVIVQAHLLPLANIFIDPAKILFLNNAINHGILTPLGTEQVSETGKSILYLLEANPGPGLGVLLAFTFLGKGSAKATAPGAILIQFFGGIHEIYFPYVMMKPLLFLAVIAGGVSGTFVFQLLGAGLRAPASPGSIVAILAMTPLDSTMSIISVVAGIGISALVTFFVATVILRADKKEGDFESKVKESQAAKKESKGSSLSRDTRVDRIIFACDAGMGSSAMGASILRKKIQSANLPQEVSNRAINQLTDETNLLIVTQEELQERARQKSPNALFIAVENFLDSPKYDEIVTLLSDEKVTADKTTMTEKNLDMTFVGQTIIKEIIIAHDEREGSATMLRKILKDMLKVQNNPLHVRKASIDCLKSDEGSLIITKTHLKEQIGKVEGTILLTDNFVNDSSYKRLIETINERQLS